jgi:hypothetical protein
MASPVQIDEIHLALLVPTDLNDPAGDAIQRVVGSKPLLTALRQAIRQVFQQDPESSSIRLRIWR